MDGAARDAGLTGRHVTWAGTEYRISLGAEESSGRLGVFHSVVPGGEGPPPHIHHDADEAIHVLEGRYAFWLDGAKCERAEGEAMFIPRGAPHAFRVLGLAPGRNLTILTPGGFERFFVDAAAADLRMPRDMAAIAALAKRYSLEFTGGTPW